MEACLSTQDHQLSYQHILLSIKLHFLVSETFEADANDPFLVKLQADSVNTDDELKNGLPERESVFDLLPLVLENPRRSVTKAGQPDAIVCKVVKEGARCG